MARPATVCSKHILETARRLFLEHGLEVSTAEIARQARVSEGSIFNRFATKQDLFCAAMGIPQPKWAQQLDQIVGQGDVRANLSTLLVQIFEFYRELLPRVMLLWSSRAHNAPQELVQGKDSPARQSLVALRDFLAREHASNRIQCAHPEALARMLLGSMFHFAFFELMKVRLDDPIDSNEYVNHVLDNLWSGISCSATGGGAR